MNLFNLDHFDKNEIIKIIELAQKFKNGYEVDYHQKKILANLFFEDSTRTHYSFDIAANKLGLKTVNFNEKTSSTQKGEAFQDTVRTFEALGADVLVIRHPQKRYYETLSNIKVPIINGGDGSGDHPTQSLLDLFTIYEQYGTFDNLNIVIVGDIKHSRVANTNKIIMTKLGMNVKLAAPEMFQVEDEEYYPIDDILEEADIVMLLRVQNERHENVNYIENYNELYGMNEKRYKKLKDKAIIMHPAPFNRGVEITDSIIDSPKSKIFEQMTNGVYLRMAVIQNVIELSK